MRWLLPWLFCGSSVLFGNEALDVLEGNKKASKVELPPAPEGSIVETARPASLIYIEPHWAPSPLDPVRAKAMLFEDPTNPWVQQMAITGFFDWQAAYGRAEVTAPGGGTTKTDLDGTRARRARLGARLRMFRNTDMEGAIEMAGSNDYRGIDYLSAETSIPGEVKVKVGKFRPHFPREYEHQAASAYPNRAMLTNMISPRSSLGVMLSKAGLDWEYGLGWFSSDKDADIPGIEGDGYLALYAARTMVEPGGLTNRRLHWHLNYLHNFDAANGGAFPRYDLVGRFSANGAQAITRNPSYRHLVSTGLTLDQDNFSLASEVNFATGSVDRAWGLTLSPSYWVIPGTLKVVARYHYAESKNPGGLTSTMGVSDDPLYDSSPFFIGDEYQSYYIGANLHLYENQMVLMGGLEQIELEDQAGAGFDAEATIWHLGAQMSF